MKIRVGIFFGGPSRERETSFAGGRAVYDNLDQSLFEPVPVFVDSYRHFILLDWQHLHKSAIRDFYPPVAYRPASAHDFPIYIESLGKLPADELDLLVRKIGRAIPVNQLSQKMDVAFIAIPSELGEEGLIQSLLEAEGIPYTGSGPEGAQTCLDEALEKKWLAERGYNTAPAVIIQREKFTEESVSNFYEVAVRELGFPLTVRPAHYSSGIGRSVVAETEGLAGFTAAMHRAFFRRSMALGRWEGFNETEKLDFIHTQTDLQTGLGFPIDIHFNGHTVTAYHPERLLAFLNEADGDPEDVLIFESHLTEKKVIVEKTVVGQAFSCLVIRREDGSAIALAPMVADGRTGAPLDAPEEQWHAIREQCERLFADLNLQAFARIDGVLTDDREIYWENVDTTPGLLPGDMIYHQGAVIGLTPSQLLTYLIRISLQERPRETDAGALINSLETRLEQSQVKASGKQRIAVLVGGDDAEERQASLEFGRNIYEKLDAAEKYAPLPVYLTREDDAVRFHLFPPGFLLLHEATALQQQIDEHQPHPELEQIRLRCAAITGKYAHEIMLTDVQPVSPEQLKNLTDAVFIALPAPAGGDGRLQRLLEEKEIPYTGVDSRAIDLLSDRYHTLEVLRKNGLKTPEQLLVKKTVYEKDPSDAVGRIESRFTYPFWVQTTTGGTDPAGRLIQNRPELEAYARLVFRADGQEGEEARRLLQLGPGPAVPRSSLLLIEAPAPKQVLQIKSGLATYITKSGELAYEVFDPTEILPDAPGNITPARLGATRGEYERIAQRIRAVIERGARVLNLQGHAAVEATVRLRPNGEVDTTISRVDAFPDLAPGSDFFQQAALGDYQPGRLFDRMLTFAQQRQAIESGQFVSTGSAAKPPGKTAADETTVAAATNHEKERRSSGRFVPPLGYPGQEDADAGLWAAVKSRAKVFASELWRFMKSPIFLRNMAGLVLLLLVLYWLLQVWLRFYTHHEQSLQVDDYTGMRVEDAMRKARRNSFSAVVMDSFFLVDRPAGIVLEQDPKPFSRVKENRTIYLIVTKKTPDEVTLPGLVGNYDYYQYARKLQRLNVRAKIRERQYSNKLEENTILYLYYDGQKITEEDLKRGIKVPMGSVVEFVITERNTGMVAIPNLVCKTYDAAAFLITSMNLNIGRIYGEAADRDNAYVYKQEPDFSAGANIPMGTSIDLYLTINKPTGCE